MALTAKPLDKVRKNIPVEEISKSFSEDLVRVNIEVKKETRQRWRAEALKREISLKELIHHCVESTINGKQKY